MKSFDPVWETKYAAGHAQRYPWDCIVSFVFRHAPRDRERRDVRVLEVGCGTGSNLWFAAREGFSVAGVDASASAIAAAQRRFEADTLNGDFHVANFTRLPFPDGTFDLVVDRCALTCCDRFAAQSAVAEVERVLKPGGRFFFNPYSDAHSSFAAAETREDGFAENIRGGSLTGVGHIRFYGRRDITELLADGWQIEAMQRVTLSEELGPERLCHEEWRVIARKE
jgi:SAM-dependent methyltransferase